MTITIVLGTQWGDEGKGKAVDVFAANYDIVARYNGGNNPDTQLSTRLGLLKSILFPQEFFIRKPRA